MLWMMAFSKSPSTNVWLLMWCCLIASGCGGRSDLGTVTGLVTLDGVVHNSDTTQQLFSGYLNGDASVTDDLKEILSRPAISAEGAKNLSITAALTHLMANVNGTEKSKVANLITQAKNMGLD